MGFHRWGSQKLFRDYLGITSELPRLGEAEAAARDLPSRRREACLPSTASLELLPEACRRQGQPRNYPEGAGCCPTRRPALGHHVQNDTAVCKGADAFECMAIRGVVPHAINQCESLNGQPCASHDDVYLPARNTVCSDTEENTSGMW